MHEQACVHTHTHMHMNVHTHTHTQQPLSAMYLGSCECQKLKLQRMIFVHLVLRPPVSNLCKMPWTPKLSEKLLSHSMAVLVPKQLLHWHLRYPLTGEDPCLIQGEERDHTILPLLQPDLPASTPDHVYTPIQREKLLLNSEEQEMGEHC